MISIDFRERSLFEECQKILPEHPSVQVESASLHIGDMRIGKTIIERKTWADLEASLKDTRYTEQSFRLQEAAKEGYRIYYWLEGDFERYHGSIPKENIRKAMFSLMEKGFFVLQTRDCKDTAKYLMEFAEKAPAAELTYEESCIHKQKNTKLNRDNISLFMLSQIPAISMKTAQILMDKYGHIREMFRRSENPSEFDDFTYDKDGKPKKLNKNVIQNLKSFLN
jgi:ERCC4-type nuclease